VQALRIAYFDCFAGASGDMVLGALIDLGVESARLQAELEKLNLPGWRLTIRSVNKNGITATKVDVLLQDATGGEALADAANTEVHDHCHHHHHDHDHDHKHEAHSFDVHRPLRVILDLLERSDLHPLDKTRATKIFTRLGEAEAKVHGVPLLDVHFHEVGGVDAIVDVVGACIGLRLLGIDLIHVSPIHVGSGFVKMAHGLYPIPAPATANLLVGAPAYATELKGELITPTGAAILTTLADAFGPMPHMVVRATGYGAGTRDREIPNVLRMVVGEQANPTGAYKTEVAVMIEANIDDMNPELYEHVMERLLSAGAMDVFLAPVLMKKGRPGNVLHVLIAQELAQQAVSIIFAETSTIGVRTYPVVKQMLEREIISVTTPFGQVGVKVARSAGKVLNVAPEYADCKAIAREQGVPLKLVYQAAQSAAAGIQ
jgi:uncharacterized protein (TIGR00299 family) protein